MNQWLLEVLNVFFFVFHTALILFNLFGWISQKTRRWHFLSLMLLLFSWLVLGFWMGFGYCFLTDWHYQVLRQLGVDDLPSSYIAFLIEGVSGWLPPGRLVDGCTLGFTVLALACSVYVNFFRKKKK